jgi:gas vesicle protein
MIFSTNLNVTIMKAQTVIIGALAGLAAGALIGILFAPDKGTEIRSKIGKKSGEYMDSVKKGFNSFVDGFTEKVNEVRDDVADVSRKNAPKREMNTSAG